jgi:hypothetical protein
LLLTKLRVYCWVSEGIIQHFTNKSKYLYTKAEKILSYRKKYSAVRHEYFVMAQKYMSYNKVLLTFTVPTDIKDKSIKNGRYTKLRKLIKIRAYIAKQINNSSDVKYFMNIELGEHYSNPHLHIQLWIKNACSIQKLKTDSTDSKRNVSKTTSKAHNIAISDLNKIDGIKDKILSTSSIPANIFDKTITKFDLNKNRCYITEPTHPIAIYNYVIKDYAKDLSDKQIWDLETQKKRFRKIMGSRVRFYSKSKDSYCKSIYRKLWYGLGIARDKANEFLDFFINKFFFFNKRNLPKIGSFVFSFSKLGYMYITYTEQGETICFDIDVLFYSPCLDPPGIYVLLYLQVKNLK